MTKESKKDKFFRTLTSKFPDLKPCPFCGCKMGFTVTHDGGYQPFGCHNGGCMLEGCGFGIWMRLDIMAEFWNRRAKEKK